MKEVDSLGSRLQRKLSQQIPGLRRKHIFDAELNLNDLTAVPFVTGNFFCVVRVNEGTSFHGKSEGSEVKRHTINWNESYNFTCKLYSGINDAVLDPCPCRISIIQEATGSSPQKRLGHVIVDLAENAGCGDSSQGLLIQQEKKNHRVGNSIFNLRASLKLRQGDVIFRTPNADTRCAEANANRRSSQRGTQDAENFLSFNRVEMRPDMKPQGMVYACDSDETRAENAQKDLHIRRLSNTTASGRAANGEKEKAMRKFNNQMERLKHQQYIEELLMKDSQDDDQVRSDIQRRPSWKDIYSKRVQRQYCFPEKTKMIIGTRVSNFDAVKDVFQNVGINTDFSDLSRSRSKTITAISPTTLTVGSFTTETKLAKLARLAKGNLKPNGDEKTISAESPSWNKPVGEKGSTKSVAESLKSRSQRSTTTTRAVSPTKNDSTTTIGESSKKERNTLTKSESVTSTKSRATAVTQTGASAKVESLKKQEMGKRGNEKEPTISKKSNQSLASIWASESGPKAHRSTPSLTPKLSSGTLQSKKGVRNQDVEFEKLMLRRLELEERNEQRAENFMKRLRSMIKKNTEKKKKRGLFRRKKQEEESFSGCAQLDVFEESESEFSWTKRKLPVLQSRPHIMNDIVELTEQRVRDQGSTLSKDSTITCPSFQSQSVLDIGSRIDLNAAKEYFTSLKQREEPNPDGHTKGERMYSTNEDDGVKYAFRDFQFRIAEEEAIKSDEDLSIRGRRQARKNKLILNMIKETNAYLLRETEDNNRHKAKLREREANEAFAKSTKSNSTDGESVITKGKSTNAPGQDSSIRSQSSSNQDVTKQGPGTNSDNPERLKGGISEELEGNESAIDENGAVRASENDLKPNVQMSE